MRHPIPVVLAFVWLILVPAARAQTTAGFGAGTGLVIGGASDLLDGGLMARASVSRAFGSRPVVSARVDATYHRLQRDRDAVSGNRASNTMLSFLAGPELSMPVWRLEPFVGAGVGVTANRLSASAGGTPTVDETSTALSWEVEGGVRISALAGAHPVAVELGASVLRIEEIGFARVNAPPQRVTDAVAVLGLRAGLRVGL